MYGLFKSIKNAVGHNNIDCIFGYLICRNDYEKYVEVKLGHENEDVDEASFVSKNHRRISFKVSDWMRFLSNDKFFYSMTRTPEEQEQMINMNM